MRTHPSSGSAPIFVADPDGPARGSLVLIHHRTGIDGFVIDIARRCVALGLLVVVPDFFAGLEPALDPEEKKARLADDQLCTELAKCRALASELAPDAGRPAVLGFCMGGRIALLAAAADLGYGKACCFYGGAIGDPWGDGPAPIARIRPGIVDIQFHRGVHDANPAMDDALALLDAVESVGGRLQLCTYTGAGHAFLNADRPEVYAADAAARAWSTAVDFLTS